MLRSRFAYVGLILIVATSACSYPATQTIIEIQADAVVRQRANEIRIDVRASNGNALRETIFLFPQSQSFPGFPIRVPVSARQGQDSRNFEVRVAAVDSQMAADGTLTVMPLATNQIRTGFVRGRVLRATLWLLSGCRCVENERCVPDENDDRVPECEPIDVDPRMEVDAGIDAMDAAVSTDAAPTDASSESTVIDPPTCSATQHLCDGRCVSNFSPNYCGATSCTACPVPENAIEATCSGTSCGFVCQTNFSECRGACVNVANDRMHCGTCGNACPEAQLCVNRQCVEPPQCTSEAGCTTPGTYCNLTSNRCESGCNDASDCSPTTEVCNTSTHRCDCLSTHHRCSQTGNACVPLTQINACGESCGMCDAPAGGTATCGGTCDFVCSSGIRCGNSCSICPNGANIRTTGCSGDVCVARTCASGYVANGLCVDVDECETQCPSPSVCENTPGSFTCSCNAPNRTCGGVCATCPADSNAVGTECANQLCVVTACRPGFVPNAARSGCDRSVLTLRAAFSLAAPPDTSSFGTIVAVSSNGLWLAARGYSTTVRRSYVAVYSRATTTTPFINPPQQVLNVFTVEGRDSYSSSLAFSDDGSVLIVAEPETTSTSERIGLVHIYERRDGSLVRTSINPGPVGSGRFGNQVACGHDSCSLLFVTDPVSFASQPRYSVMHLISRVTGGGLSARPTQSIRSTGALAVGSRTVFILSDSDGFRVFRRGSTGSFPETPAQSIALAGSTYDSACSEDCATFARLSTRGLEIFRRISPERYSVTPDQSIPMNIDSALALSGDGRQLFVGDSDSASGTGVVHVYM